jgi:hypothetical protein
MREALLKLGGIERESSVVGVAISKSSSRKVDMIFKG